MKIKDYDYSEDKEIEDNRNAVNKILKKHFREVNEESTKPFKKKDNERTRIKSY